MLSLSLRRPAAEQATRLVAHPDHQLSATSTALCGYPRTASGSGSVWSGCARRQHRHRHGQGAGRCTPRHRRSLQPPQPCRRADSDGNARDREPSTADGRLRHTSMKALAVSLRLMYLASTLGLVRSQLNTACGMQGRQPPADNALDERKGYTRAENAGGGHCRRSHHARRNRVGRCLFGGEPHRSLGCPRVLVRRDHLSLAEGSRTPRRRAE